MIHDRGMREQWPFAHFQSSVRRNDCDESEHGDDVDSTSDAEMFTARHCDLSGIICSFTFFFPFDL